MPEYVPPIGDEPDVWIHWPAQHADYERLQQTQGNRERHTLFGHLRQHGRATPAHVWASDCRWCHLSSWLQDVRKPVPYDAFDVLQQRVRKLEQERHTDGGGADA